MCIRRFAMSVPGTYSPGPYPRDVGRASLAYLEGVPVSLGEAVIQGFLNAVVYRGRASRSAYWWFVLFQGIVLMTLDILGFIPRPASREAAWASRSP
jgi:hypothetical protein